MSPDVDPPADRQSYLLQPPPDLAAEMAALDERGRAAISDGRFDVAFELYRRMYERMLATQPRGRRYHKGLPLHNMGLVRLRVAALQEGLTNTMLAFIEDALSRAEESPQGLDELAYPAAGNLRLFGLTDELVRVATEIRHRFAISGPAFDPKVLYEQLDLGALVRRIVETMPAEGSASLFSDAVVERSYALPPIRLELGELREYVGVVAAVAPESFLLKAVHGSKDEATSIPSRDLSELIKHVPMRSISLLVLSGRSLGGTRVEVRLPLDSCRPATVHLDGRRDSVGQIRELVEGDLLARAGTERVARLRALQSVVIISLVMSLILAAILTLSLDRLDVNLPTWQPASIAIVTLILLVTKYALDIRGKLLPSVYVPNAGRYDWLRSHSWRIVRAAAGIATATFLAWIVTGPGSSLR